MRIGNDIVDLLPLESRQKVEDSRFIKRVYTLSEMKAIQEAQHPNSCLWALWAIKEALFKALQKTNLNLTFSHQQFFPSDDMLHQLIHADLTACIEGITCIDQTDLAIQVLLHTDYVHATAVTFDSLQELDWTNIHLSIARPFASRPTRPEQSAAVRELSCQNRPNELSHMGNLCIKRPMNRIKSRERPGPPALYDGDILLADYDISLSHDYRFVASAWTRREHSRS